jgi:hypothetical protein
MAVLLWGDRPFDTKWSPVQSTSLPHEPATLLHLLSEVLEHILRQLTPESEADLLRGASHLSVLRQLCPDEAWKMIPRDRSAPAAAGDLRRLCLPGTTKPCPGCVHEDGLPEKTLMLGPSLIHKELTEGPVLYFHNEARRFLCTAVPLACTKLS